MLGRGTPLVAYLLLARRLVTMSPEFTRALHTAITEQATNPYNAASHDADIAYIRRRYRDSANMLDIAIATCLEGE